MIFILGVNVFFYIYALYMYILLIHVWCYTILHTTTLITAFILYFIGAAGFVSYGNDLERRPHTYFGRGDAIPIPIWISNFKQSIGRI